jgi:hypothetical protein
MSYFDEVNENYGGSDLPDDYGGYLDPSYAKALVQQQENEQRAADQAQADYIAASPDYRDYGSPSGAGAAGTSYDFGAGASGGGLKNILNKLTRDSKGNLDYAKLAMLLYGAKTLAKGNQPAPKFGFQGVIPTSTATTNLRTAPPPGRKAGAYGILGCAASFIRELRGSYTGVMGLPLFETTQLLQRCR